MTICKGWKRRGAEYRPKTSSALSASLRFKFPTLPNLATMVQSGLGFVAN